MKILIFTEGTILMHLSANNVSRIKRVKQSKSAGIQREERNIAYDANVEPPKVEKGSVYDLSSYVPIGNAVNKILGWKNQGAKICYLTSRRLKSEINAIQKVLKKCGFPNTSDLYFRKKGKNYRDVAGKIMPNILIEDDCESIGDEVEMTYPNMKPKLKKIIKSIPVKEFGGIDHLPDNINELLKY